LIPDFLQRGAVRPLSTGVKLLRNTDPFNLVPTLGQSMKLIAREDSTELLQVLDVSFRMEIPSCLPMSPGLVDVVDEFIREWVNFRSFNWKLGRRN
jgi:hypothetical protein